MHPLNAIGSRIAPIVILLQLMVECIRRYSIHCMKQSPPYIQMCNVQFKAADMRSFEIPPSDAILFNDSLHYVDANSQQQILCKAAASLNIGGSIVVRDGDAGQTEGHEKIKSTEVWSTEIIKFYQSSAL